jgi:hypothetical protein
LSNGLPQNLTIKLPPGDPPFRVTYFVLEEQAIDFLLHSKMNAKWEEKLGGQPFIVPNEVSKTLSDLVSAYSEETTYDYLEVENKGKSKSYDVSEKESPDKYFAGSNERSELYISDPGNLVRSMEDSRQPWRVFYTKNATRIGIDWLVFRKFIDSNDLNLCEDSPFKRFYQHVTKDYMPPDFGYVDIYFFEDVDGCGSDGSGISYVGTHLVGRSLGLRIAVLENITKEPINLGNFAIRTNRQQKLRTREDDKMLLNSQPTEEQALFPQRVLTPGEKIVIPLELPLSFKKNRFSPFSDEAPVTQTIRGSITSELKKLDEIKFPVYGRNSTFVVSARTVEEILKRPSQDFRLNKEYLYGPSMSIENLVIDKISYPFRQFDSAKIVIRGGRDEGSCPYIYTYSTKDRIWLNEGVILYGINQKHKETTDEKELIEFDGRVLIKEKDPEVSFIDAVYIKAILIDGSQRLIYPKNKTLRFADRNYLKLKQGEEIRIDFDLSHPSKISKYILGVSGYYIPRDKTSRSRSAPFAKQRLRPTAAKLRA